MSDSRVFLPQPDGPTIETNSHGPICMETSFSALTCISSPRPYSRETASRRSPTAWPRRSGNSSAGGASVSGRRTAGSRAGLWPFPLAVGGGGGPGGGGPVAVPRRDGRGGRLGDDRRGGGHHGHGRGESLEIVDLGQRGWLDRLAL